jgi:hypothetical protein
MPERQESSPEQVTWQSPMQITWRSQEPSPSQRTLHSDPMAQITF